jgi:Carboxypeptidase regulatory-like domain
MRMRAGIGFLVSVLAALPAQAQDTRGNINRIVQDRDGVIPGAVVRITNTDTKQTQQLVTNSKGYFEAVLLNAGTYAVRVELKGYKTLSQTRAR